MTILIIVIFIHFSGCLLVLIAIDENNSYKNSWIEEYFNRYKIPLNDLRITELYLTTIYWTVTTISTVGYGDIVPVDT